MHNFGVPSVLKLWIDQIARVGRIFSYGEKGPKGLIVGKKATFIIATVRDLRRPDADGLVQLRRAVPAVRIRFSWRERRNLPHRRWDQRAEPGEGPEHISRTTPSSRADARTNRLERTHT